MVRTKIAVIAEAKQQILQAQLLLRNNRYQDLVKEFLESELRFIDLRERQLSERIREAAKHLPKLHSDSDSDSDDVDLFKGLGSDSASGSDSDLDSDSDSDADSDADSGWLGKRKKEEPQLSNKKQKVEIDAFSCPILYQKMKDPVICCDGHTYERKAIEQWLENNNTSPLTNKVLTSKKLTTNYALKNAIEEFS